MDLLSYEIISAKHGKAVFLRCSVKGVLKASQNSQENAHGRVLNCSLATLLKRDSSIGVFHRILQKF